MHMASAHLPERHWEPTKQSELGAPKTLTLGGGMEPSVQPTQSGLSYPSCPSPLLPPQQRT